MSLLNYNFNSEWSWLPSRELARVIGCDIPFVQQEF